jgi:hypothetical protein
MKKSLFFAIGLSLAAMQGAGAATPSCYMSKVQDSSGATLSLITGYYYLVVPGQDRVIAGQWRPLEKVEVCRAAGSNSKLTNISKTPPQSIIALRQGY